MARMDEEVIREAPREATRRLREDWPKLLDLLGRVLDANRNYILDKGLMPSGRIGAWEISCATRGLK